MNQWLTHNYLVFNLVHDVRTSMPGRDDDRPADGGKRRRRKI
jgi:hypothetical protein